MHLACNCPRKWWFGDPHSWCQVFAKQRPLNSLLEATRWAGPLGAGWVQCWGKKGESTDGTPLLKLLSQGLECPRSEILHGWYTRQHGWLSKYFDSETKVASSFFWTNWLHRHPAPYFLFSCAGVNDSDVLRGSCWLVATLVPRNWSHRTRLLWTSPWPTLQRAERRTLPSGSWFWMIAVELIDDPGDDGNRHWKACQTCFYVIRPVLGIQQQQHLPVFYQWPAVPLASDHCRI